LMRSPDAAHAREYLQTRGYGSAMAKNWQIGWMPEHAAVFFDWARAKKYTGGELVRSGLCYVREEGNPKSGLQVRFRDRLMFPVRNEIGDVIAFSGRQLRVDPNRGKYVNSPETSLFVKSRVLFALDRAKKPILREKSALLCEGQLDVISCHEAGVDHALAPLGTAFTEDHARLLKRFTGHVTACFDSDRAGVTASERLFRVIAPHGLAMRVVCMPEGDDPDTYLKRNGVDAFRVLLAEAKEFFDFKLEQARKAAELEDPASRNRVLKECAEILADMSDMAAREHGINTVVAHLQTSSQALRDEVAMIRKRPQRPIRMQTPADDESEAVIATPLHRIVGYLCHLALISATAQHYLADQFETLHEAAAWLEGVPLLEAIVAVAPDPQSPAEVNAYLSTLREPDRMALVQHGMAMEGMAEDPLQAAERALELLSGIVLQKRDAAIKASLKEPGLTSEKMVALLEEAKEIAQLLRGIPQRSEFDDELPKSTYKAREPEWKQKWRER
jgi:DNA primase